MSPQRTPTGEGSDTTSPPHDAGAAGKRKSDDAGGQPRAKRNRYISIACNECKRRKIKCNGQTPCQRCGNLGLECLYAPNCCNNFKESDEFKHMTAHMHALQQQVDDLFHSLAALRTHVDLSTSNITTATNHANTNTNNNSTSPFNDFPRPGTKSFTKHPRFHGPTANAFNLGVARSSLKTMGITAADDPDDDGLATNDPTPRPSPPFAQGNPHCPPPQHPLAPLHADKDPIWSISKQEALRLVHVWHEEQGIMYPILDMDKVLRYTDMLFSFVEAAARSGLMQGALPGADAIMDDQTSVLKLVLAITLVMEGGGKDPLGEKLFENVQKVVERILSEPVSLQSISLLTLTGMYHFTRDDEALSWRMIGLAARHCLELGLHRRETYSTQFPDPDEQASAIRIFWSVYVLDRRWSLGTGMPFALQDADIDYNLMKPDVSTHTSTPYLNAMIAYSAIGSKVWKSVASTSSPSSPSDVKISKEDISFLDFQVLNWHRSIPEPLKFKHPDAAHHPPSEPPPRVQHRLQILLYLRANQMRILIYRPVLHTATTILSHLDFAHTVVKVAKDTIRILTYINRTSDIYRVQQTMFNYFLTSALAVLFLAVAHAPAEFSAPSRDEFYMALDLVRQLSSNSHVSKRLWRTVRTLKEVGPRLGLLTHDHTAGDPHANAAVAMAGLAGHPVDESALWATRTHDQRSASVDTNTHSTTNHNGTSNSNSNPYNGPPSTAPSHLDTPHGMALDLTTLFEAAGGTFGLNGFEGLGMAEGYAQGYAQDDELARIMGGLF